MNENLDKNHKHELLLFNLPEHFFLIASSWMLAYLILVLSKH